VFGILQALETANVAGAAPWSIGVVTSQDFDPHTGRLKTILAGTGTSYIVENFSYTYDTKRVPGSFRDGVIRRRQRRTPRCGHSSEHRRLVVIVALGAVPELSVYRYVIARAQKARRSML
jgi:hypothetical protein